MLNKKEIVTPAQRLQRLASLPMKDRKKRLVRACMFNDGDAARAILESPDFDINEPSGAWEDNNKYSNHYLEEALSHRSEQVIPLLLAAGIPGWKISGTVMDPGIYPEEKAWIKKTMAEHERAVRPFTMHPCVAPVTKSARLATGVFMAGCDEIKEIHREMKRDQRIFADIDQKRGKWYTTGQVVSGLAAAACGFGLVLPVAGGFFAAMAAAALGAVGVMTGGAVMAYGLAAAFTAVVGVVAVPCYAVASLKPAYTALRYGTGPKKEQVKLKLDGARKKKEAKKLRFRQKAGKKKKLRLTRVPDLVMVLGQKCVDMISAPSMDKVASRYCNALVSDQPRALRYALQRGAPKDDVIKGFSMSGIALAVAYDRDRCLPELIAAGADVNNPFDPKPAIELAIEGEKRDAFLLLTGAKATISEQTLELAEKNGLASVLRMAEAEGHDLALLRGYNTLTPKFLPAATPRTRVPDEPGAGDELELEQQPASAPGRKAAR